MPFQPGQSGNPAGRPVGSRNKVNRDLDEAFSAGGAELIVCILERAKAGDPAAMRLCMDRALPMTTGAEGVETAIKCVRKWGYLVKKVPANQAEIIVCAQNFHGRTTTIVGFSSEPQYRDHFGPYGGGFVSIPFGDAKALEKAITPNTVAFLVEPIQGEGGIIVPPEGYLTEALRICRSMFDAPTSAFEGRHYRFGEMTFRPTPVQQPSSPKAPAEQSRRE